MKTKDHQFAKAIRVFNCISLIMSTWYSYKHYFDNDGKGFNDIFYAVCMLSLFGFFAVAASLSSKSLKSKKQTIVFGIIYMLACTLYLEVEVLTYAFVVSVLPITLFFIGLLSNNQIKINRVLDYVMCFSLMLSILPTYSFLLFVVAVVQAILK